MSSFRRYDKDDGNSCDAEAPNTANKLKGKNYNYGQVTGALKSINNVVLSFQGSSTISDSRIVKQESPAFGGDKIRDSSFQKPSEEEKAFAFETSQVDKDDRCVHPLISHKEGPSAVNFMNQSLTAGWEDLSFSSASSNGGGSSPDSVIGGVPRNRKFYDAGHSPGSFLVKSSGSKLSDDGNLDLGIIYGSSLSRSVKFAAGNPAKGRFSSQDVTNVGNLCRVDWNANDFNRNGNNCSAARANDKVNASMGNVLRAGGLITGPLDKASRKADEYKGIANSATDKIHFATESTWLRRVLLCTNAEEVKNAGNELYTRGLFTDALQLYDRAILLSPGQTSYHSNRAAALIALGHLAEAVRECEEVIKLDPLYERAHERVASLYLRLGLVCSARRHLIASKQNADCRNMRHTEVIEKHISRCIEARKAGDWKTVIRESDAAVVAGADSAPEVFGYKAEALVKLGRPEEAHTVLSAAERVESSLVKSEIVPANTFLSIIKCQIEMALGRFESAIMAAESVVHVNPQDTEVYALLKKAGGIGQARTAGNDLFNKGKFFEACAAYGEGLEIDPTNAVLLCNRAACRSKLGQWEKAVEDCNAALYVDPNYTKARMRRAHSNAKLELWEDAIRDFEILRREIPDNMEVARGLFDVQVAMKKSRGEETHKMKFGGVVEEVSNNDQFREGVTSPGLTVVKFSTRSSNRCKQISPFLDQLCKCHPSVNFLKVDVDNNPYLSKMENISFVPTFKLYKNGLKVKEIIGPTEQALEYAVKHYSL